MNKANGGGGIQVELIQILKYDAVKVLHSIWQQMWKTLQMRLEKVNFHSSLKGMPKNVQTATQLHSSHTLAK